VLSVFRAPNSYTGEDVVEITCHCNPFIIKEILDLLLRTSRLAYPGEFTQRAFFNNKMDLTKAEAVGDLLNASTLHSHHAAISQLEGSLYRRISKALNELTNYRTELELEIDFVEQDLPEIDINELHTRLNSLLKNLRNLLATGKEGLLIREGLSVVLVGEPNVGKSSLFNSLLETDRALVHQTPGTTRDYLEESLSIEGYLVRLFDTAGLRETDEEVESGGIEKTRKLLEKADKIIYVVDCPSLIPKELDSQADKLIKLLNKSDIHSSELKREYEKEGYVICSAKTGEGLDLLKERIIDSLHLATSSIDEGILSNVRQINAVKKSIVNLEAGLRGIENSLGYEFIAYDLKEASEALEEIVGKVTGDDILDRIFENFCIGK
jgi:tRNA modification GTPase